MNFPVVKRASYVLVNTPDMVVHNGTTQTLERKTNPDSDYLKQIKNHLRSFEDVVSYAPNQTYIGNMAPEELSERKRPWYNEKVDGSSRFGKFGEIMCQDEFYGLLKISDVFDLVILEKSFTEAVKESFKRHPILKDRIDDLKEGESIENIKRLVNDGIAEGLYRDDKLVGCVKRAHEFDPNLSAHTMIENLSVKASGVLALMYLVKNSGLDVSQIDYLIE
ncbi:glycine reductase, partial [Clostridium sp. HV4-5-A1G]